ncbi:hypothetical protein [Streptomyces sp. KR80]|uniref:hypothetical protein n=1 Tax=Streptomyces sp. KR80 TaxID=3457426 RepID=UPI003FD4F278
MGIPAEILIRKLQSSRLEVLEIQGNQPGPTVDDAWTVVANINISPKAKAPRDHVGRESVNTVWQSQAESAGVFSTNGEFLITAVTTGCSQVGWVRVRRTPEIDVSALTDDQGGIEFIALSPDRQTLCAVTTEEYEYWIVSESMSDW